MDSRVRDGNTSPEVKIPINLKLGSQRVRLGSEIHRPDGTTIYALGTPGLGFHGSIHPTGLIKISGNLGFGDQIVEILEASFEYLSELPEESGIEPLGYVQSQFESLDQEQLLVDIGDLVGGMNPPVLRRFTLEGFEPL